MSIYGAIKKRLSGLSHKQKDRIARCLGGHNGSLLRFLRNRAKHDEIYDEKYYEHVERAMAQSAKIIAESIIQEFGPKTVVDVGCGSGALLSRFASFGVDVEGLEYSEAALKICRTRGLAVHKFDLESGARHGQRRFDVCISTEVAEHIPSDLAEVYVQTLCNHSDLCVITAATPGQGGTDHVNEQPHEYWISLFAGRNYSFDVRLSGLLRDKWRHGGAEHWYYKNAMVFSKKTLN